MVRNVANQYGKTVTFMPKPLFQDNGSGIAIRNRGRPKRAFMSELFPPLKRPTTAS